MSLIGIVIALCGYHTHSCTHTHTRTGSHSLSLLLAHTYFTLLYHNTLFSYSLPPHVFKISYSNSKLHPELNSHSLHSIFHLHNDTHTPTHTQYLFLLLSHTIHLFLKHEHTFSPTPTLTHTVSSSYTHTHIQLI